jgi:glycosyltransferase involved in cell wall biosynthesis
VKSARIVNDSMTGHAVDSIMSAMRNPGMAIRDAELAAVAPTGLAEATCNNCTITFVYESPHSWAVQDLRILGRIFHVIPVQWMGVVSIVKLMLAVLRCDVVFVWWMSGQAAIAAFVCAKAFRKKTVFVAGGSEVSVDRDSSGRGRDPRSRIRFGFTKAIIRFVDCVIPVSEFTLREVLAISAPRRYRVVYHAVDTDRFTCNYKERKERSVITVAAGQGRRKGLDRYARLSQYLPNFTFRVIGSASSDTGVRNLFPPGACMGRVSEDELVSFYQEATFYCQLSRHEAFGVAVAEAMACECVPIVSNSGALPEVVGDCGIVVPNGDPLVAARLISGSLTRTRSLGRSARRRILSKFSMERRSRELRGVILSLTHPPS